MSRVAVVLATLLVPAPGATFSFHDSSYSAKSTSGFVCPMHPDMRSAAPGTCSRCGMALTAVAAGSSRSYDVQLRTGLKPVQAGRPFPLELVVREPETARIVKGFVNVHERRFHLFVISEDLEFYTHLHPAQRQDGSWRQDVTLPRTGRYRVYADFRPAGGAPQVITRALVTEGVEGDALTGTTLVPDHELRRVAGSMSVELDLPADGAVAGGEQSFSYRVSDAATGAPVTDLEPYLGAWGHSLLLSEDMSHFVHAHPSESITRGSGGPALTFKAALPSAGVYRIWTQFKRRGQVSTAVFTVAVGSDSQRRE